MQATVKHVISIECKNNTENVDPKTKNGRTIKNKKKKSRFMKEHEASGLLSSLGIKTPLSNIPLLGKDCFNYFVYNFIVLNLVNAIASML